MYSSSRYNFYLQFAPLYASNSNRVSLASQGDRNGQHPFPSPWTRERGKEDATSTYNILQRQRWGGEGGLGGKRITPPYRAYLVFLRVYHTTKTVGVGSIQCVLHVRKHAKDLKLLLHQFGRKYKDQFIDILICKRFLHFRTKWQKILVRFFFSFFFSLSLT